VKLKYRKNPEDNISSDNNNKEQECTRKIGEKEILLTIRDNSYPSISAVKRKKKRQMVAIRGSESTYN